MTVKKKFFVEYYISSSQKKKKPYQIQFSSICGGEQIPSVMVFGWFSNIGEGGNADKRTTKADGTLIFRILSDSAINKLKTKQLDYFVIWCNC